MYRKTATIPICKALATAFSDEFVAKLVYRARFGKCVNLEAPRTFNEKIMWLKLRYYPHSELAIRCADKYAVRAYVEAEGYQSLLNDLIAVWETPEDIDWSSLPSSFAMKCNHGMGYNIICPDIEELDLEDAKRSITRWFREDFGYETSEPHYRGIQRKVVMERYLVALGSKVPVDWQFFCFNGAVRMILVRQPGTSGKGGYSHYLFDNHWNSLDYVRGERPRSIERPACFGLMSEAASALSRPFPFVRVDFYVENGTPIFGEMTFTSSSGYSKTFSDEGQIAIGDWLDISDLRGDWHEHWPDRAD